MIENKNKRWGIATVPLLLAGLAYSAQVYAVDCSGFLQYSAGTSYTAGQNVQNLNQGFSCTVPGWCSLNAAWAYGPGEGSSWQSAWTNLGDCEGGQGDNIPPTVSVTAPSGSITAGSTLSLSANASDSDGSILFVEFFIDNISIGSDASAPYSVNWTATSGSHTFTATAVDNDSASTTSTGVSFTVGGGGSGGFCDDSYNAGSTYTNGDQVNHNGNTYTCKVAGWCSANATWAYEPGAVFIGKWPGKITAYASTLTLPQWSVLPTLSTAAPSRSIQL